MTKKRLLILFCIMVAGFTLLQARLFVMMTDDILETSSDSQTLRKTVVAVQWPDFLDCRGEKLTNLSAEPNAVVYPTSSSAYNVIGYVRERALDAFIENMGGSLPFVVPLSTEMPGGPVQTVYLPQRYGETALAPHLIGYLGFEGNGVAGLEAVFDDYLAQNARSKVLEYEVNAQGMPTETQDAWIADEGDVALGIQLTIDKRIQKLCEFAADDLMERGAIVVVDCESAEVRALVSRPGFDQNDIAAALEAEGAPLLDRTLAAYNIGSIYKPLIAACALHSGLRADFTYECTGSIEVDGFTYTCNDSTAHGSVTIETALIHSCNCYFIALGQQLGAEPLYHMGQSLKLGREIALWDGYADAAGSTPTLSQLKTGGELCLHCFGQGRLLMSPLHVAAATNCLANHGTYTDLSIVKSVGEEAAKPSASREVFSAESADLVAAYLAKVVSDGTGSNAQPSSTTAAGKTGTAQTGRYHEDGTEILVGWFTGWFPADNPRYIVTVMVEDEDYGYVSAAPIFARVADEINRCGY